VRDLRFPDPGPDEPAAAELPGVELPAKVEHTTLAPQTTEKSAASDDEVDHARDTAIQQPATDHAESGATLQENVADGSIGDGSNEMQEQTAPAQSVAAAARDVPRFLFQADELSVAVRGAPRPELDRISLTITRGETVVLFGEQGCGKEALLRTAAGALEAHETKSGNLLLGGEEPGVSALRVVYLPGPQLKPLSPRAPVALQLARIIARRTLVPPSAAAEDLRVALSRIEGAPAFATLMQSPARLAPGALAYALLASAMAQTPDLLLVERLVADLPLMESRQLIAALKAEQARLGFAILYSARGAHIINWLDGRVVVMRQGRIVEEGTLDRLVSGAAHAYTRTLFQALPRMSAESPVRPMPRGETLLQVRGLELARSEKSERALSREGLTFELRRGASLALVGEEGSGRRKLARTLIGLERPGAGRIVLDAVDIGILSEGMLQRMRRRVAFIVGTDHVLDERMTAWDTVAEPLRAHLKPMRDVLAAQTENALKRVGLSALAKRTLVRQLSAFDRRRLQIARAIVTQPHIAIIEEPLRGLDAFAQGVVRDLLREFRRSEVPAFLVITADFSVADALAEEAFVFKAGRVVERGPLDQLLRQPKEQATRNLIAAVTAAALPREAARG
jgi:peptide/nickel transport system ATP-binding protein